MKKPVKLMGAGIAFSICLCAHAQPAPVNRLANNVTIYGLVDSGVERLTNASPTHGGLTRVPTLTGTLPSRLGFRGAENLGGSMWAQFALETGFAPDTGNLNQGGRMFGRQSFVALTGPWGSVSAGRQYENFYLATLDGSIFGPNAYGLASLDPYISAARFDNSVAYLGQFGGFGVGASHSFGRDVATTAAGTVCAGESATDKQACKASSLMLKYTTPTWGVASGWSRLNGAPTAAGGLRSSSLHDDRATINAYYRGDGWKMSAGVIRRDNDGRPTHARSNLYWLEGAYAATPALSLEAMVGQLRYAGNATRDQSTLYAVRALYSLSKRAAVYATAGRMKNEGLQALSASSSAAGGAPPAGEGQTGLMVGFRTSF